MIKNFKIGDRVSWETKVSKISVRKKGEIVHILEPGEDLNKSLDLFKARFNCYPVFNEGDLRDYVSYAVLVRDSPSIPRLYWPKVEDLIKIHSISKVKRPLKIKRSIKKKKDKK